MPSASHVSLRGDRLSRSRALASDTSRSDRTSSYWDRSESFAELAPEPDYTVASDDGFLGRPPFLDS